MAFAYAVTDKTILGNKRVTWGTFTNSALTAGGDIVTGLDSVDSFMPCITSHYWSTAPMVTRSVSSGTVTVATENNVDGEWLAIGK